MKFGKTLSALASEIERTSAAKRDFIASSNALEVTTITPPGFDPAAVAHGSAKPRIGLLIPGQSEAMPILDHAHGQLAAHLDIPKKYYDRMRDTAPALLTDNVNTWLRKAPARERRMLRTLDGRARAFLSDKFQPFDNDLIAEAALETLHSVGNLEVRSCELTETRLYIKATFPSIQREVKVGDVVESGVLISNSEVGAGAVEIVPFSYRLVCSNGMKHNDWGQRRNHVGGRLAGSEGSEIFASDTLRADAKAFLLRFRDTLRACMDPAHFEKIVAQMADAAAQRVEGDPVKAVEVLAKRFTFTDGEKGSVLRHLISGGDLSRWGVANAVTRAAEDVADYDRASELESVGGRVIELPQTHWREIAAAA